MTLPPDRRSSSPLPAALLTLAVVVCLGGVAQAGTLPTAVPAQQRRPVLGDRESLGQLVAVFAEAARKLGRHHETQPALHAIGQASAATLAAAPPLGIPADAPRQPAPLRAELTHLPPPALG